MPLALEVIAVTVDDALAAEQGGAARIELVIALERGGMTPPLALVDAVFSRVRIPVRVMVRQTEAHEVPDPALRRRLVEQAREIGQRPVDGLVFGALSGGYIDEALVDAVAGAGGRRLTFHRAFEQLTDPAAAVQLLARHPAVDRVLCNGGPGDWAARVARLAAWNDAAQGGLTFVVGGGVTDETIEVVAAIPGLAELHVGRLVRDPPTVEGPVSADRVADLVERLTRLERAAGGLAP